MPNLTLLAAGGSLAFDELSTLNPASPQTESIRFLFIFLCATSLVILAVVWGVLVYCLARFRRPRSLDGQQQSPSEPPQKYGSMPIEIAWTVAPALIVSLLTLVIVRTEFEVRVGPRREAADVPHAVRVSVIGHQWWWEYELEQQDGKVVTANELHVPASTDVTRPIYLTLQSADVCHSFWVPRLAGKMDLIPGRVNELWFATGQTGLFLGQCAEYCGSQHANMLLSVSVDSPEQFAAWLANEAKPAIESAAAREGRDAFFAQSCVNCHTIRGTAAHGKVGPDLTHFASRKTMAGGMIPLNLENVRYWIRDPQSVKPGCLMPAFGLSDRDVTRIADYLMTLR